MSKISRKKSGHSLIRLGEDKTLEGHLTHNSRRRSQVSNKQQEELGGGPDEHHQRHV